MSVYVWIRTYMFGGDSARVTRTLQIMGHRIASPPKHAHNPPSAHVVGLYTNEVRVEQCATGWFPRDLSLATAATPPSLHNT